MAALDDRPLRLSAVVVIARPRCAISPGTAPRVACSSSSGIALAFLLRITSSIRGIHLPFVLVDFFTRTASRRGRLTACTSR